MMAFFGAVVAFFNTMRLFSFSFSFSSLLLFLFVIDHLSEFHLVYDWVSSLDFKKIDRKKGSENI
jgi:hypothetical protein